MIIKSEVINYLSKVEYLIIDIHSIPISEHTI